MSRWRWGGADRWAVAVLALVPLAMFVAPALAGHPVIAGDNSLQNYPLRVLVGSQIRHGHLPLLDPYLWSGAPLLGGWNAGAAYPFTWLFVCLPATAAWTLNLVITWWVTAIGSYGFLRASKLGPVASFLGAASFSFAGSTIAQQVHFGLVAGVSWVPLELLALLKMSELVAQRPITAPRRQVRARSTLGWTVLLATAGAMTVLAGEPRAITDAAVIVGVYAGWRFLRLGRLAGRYGAWVAGALVLAVALSAVQWLPGLDAVHTSQRAASSSSLFTSGSLANRWLLLLVVPDLLGGSGSFGQPPFLASYSLPEVTSYVGIMPLVASFALLGRLRWRRPLPEWVVWEVMAAVGVVLALGGNTPLWHVLVRIPFFGGQRLQSRNIVIADLAFAFLLAYWADAWLAARTRARAGPSDRGAAPSHRGWARLGWARARAPQVLASIPALAAVATVAVALAWSGGLLRWLGVTPAAAGDGGALRVWLVPYGVLGLAAVGLVWWGRLLPSRRRAAALVTFVVVDLAVFTLMVMVTVAPGLGSSTPATSAAAPRSGASPGASAPSPPTTHPASSYRGSGRFAIYDPDNLDAGGLTVLDQTDLNVPLGVPSMQGYSAIVDGTYATAAITPFSTGYGRDNLIPAAVGAGTLDQLETTALLSPRDYFLVQSGSDPVSQVPTAGRRHLGADGRATWYLGEDLSVRSVVVPDATAAADLHDGLRVGVVSPTGTTTWAPAPTPAGPDQLRFSFGHPQAAVALVARAGPASTGLGSPTVTAEDGTSYVADGELEAAVVPPRWAYTAQDGAFAVFTDRDAGPALAIRGPAGASVRATGGPAFAPSAAEVSSPHGTEVIRSVAAIPGWRATWQPETGPDRRLAVRRVGLIQGVDVPAGRGTLTWTYDPPGWTAGWMASAGGLVVLAVLGLWAWVTGRRLRLNGGLLERTERAPA